MSDRFLTAKTSVKEYNLDNMHICSGSIIIWTTIYCMKQIFTADVKLAYRMRRPLAVKTLEKLKSVYPNAEITKYDEAKVA